MVQENRTFNALELIAFSEVVRAGGITAAADKLGVSKSTVSMQISRLEKRLGIKLLTRTSRRIALTREGELTLPKVQSLLAEIDQLFDDTARARGTPEGVVRIATTPAFGKVALDRLVPLVRQKYPDVKLVVKPTYDIEDLQDPAFDFAIRIGVVKDESLVATNVGTFDRILIASPGFLEENPIETPEQLTDMSCLCFSERSTQHEWRLVHEDSGDLRTISIDATVAVRSYSTLQSLAERGLGVASLAPFAVQPAIDAGKLVHYLPKWRSPPVPVMLAHRFGATKIIRVAAVMELAKTVIAEILV